MNLLEQCQAWNENDEYQKIIDSIEALAEGDRSPELDSELARAYNNIAGVGDRELYEKAVHLLKPHEAYFEGDHCWNFRMAYAYYYLDQEGPALRYFEQALEARPGDEDTKEFIDDCRRRLSLPRFEKNFRQRAREAWASFLQREEELRRLMDYKNQEEAGEELIAACERILRLAFEDIAFELGFNGEKYELILTPEGDSSKLFELTYFQRLVPQSLLERWNVWVGRQRTAGFGLRSFGLEITEKDVQVWVERTEGEQISLSMYCEKILPLLREEEGKAWWMLSTLTDQVLGEIAAMALIDSFDVLQSPREQPSVALAELPEALKSMGVNLQIDSTSFLENSYLAYQMDPNEDVDADWRLDVFAGSTRCPALVNDYLSGESKTMDAFHQDGAVPGFICYPMNGFTGENRGKEAMEFRDALEDAILQQAGEDAVTFLGGASGLYCGYLDFIAWDLPAVLDAAVAFFKGGTAAWAGFHTFRRDVGTVRLFSGGEDDTVSTHE